MDYKNMSKDDLIKIILEKEQKKINNISNCTITTKIWDEKAIEGLNDVAKALLNMTELYKSTNINAIGLSL